MSAGLPGFVQRRLDPEERFGLRLTLFGAAVAVVAVPFGILLDQVVRKGPLVRTDASAARILHGWLREHPWLVTPMKIVTFVGTPPWFVLVVAVAAFFLWRRKRLRLLAFLVATSLGGGIVDSIVKILVDRDRPNFADPFIPLHGKSFPSGHAMSSVVVYGALLLVFFPAIAKPWRPRLVVAAVLLVAAIGCSRLALGVHYVTDVLGGYLLGLAWLAASTAAFSVWRQERGRRPVEPMRGLEPEAGRDLHVG